MAQTNYTPISLYYSTTASAVPTAANLVQGELAINTADGKLYYEDSSGVVQTLASKAGALGDVVGPASATDNALARFDLTTGKLIQNSVGILSDAGVLTGLTGLTSSGSITLSSLTSGRVTYAGASGLLQDDADFTFNGTTVTMANDASISGLTVGKGAGAISTNTAVGASALAANTTGAQNVAIGDVSLNANTTADGNTAVGWASLNLSTGAANTAVGRSSLGSTTSGANNTAVGYQALVLNTTASNNTAVGYQAGYTNSTGAKNVFIGQQAGKVSTGNFNTIIGNEAGLALTTGTCNTFVGGYNNTVGGSGETITSGSKNTILGVFTGNQGGLDIRTASNYIVLSDGDGNPRAYVDNSAQFNINVNSGTRYTNFLLNNATLTKAQMYWDDTNTNLYVQCASGGVYLTNTGTSWTSNSDERLKENLVPIENGLSKVCSLRSVIGNFIADETKKSTPFLIAQDVQMVLPEAVTTSTIKGDETNTEYLGVAYTEVIPLLVAAIKELKAEFDAYKATHP